VLSAVESSAEEGGGGPGIVGVPWVEERWEWRSRSGWGGVDEGTGVLEPMGSGDTGRDDAIRDSGPVIPGMGENA
jgi:hypothetical protein